MPCMLFFFTKEHILRDELFFAFLSYVVEEWLTWLGVDNHFFEVDDEMSTICLMGRNMKNVDR